MPNMYRQGDVLIIAVASIPQEAEVVQEGGEIVLARGESTGHHHFVVSDSTLLFRPPVVEENAVLVNAQLRAPQERGAGRRSQVRGYLKVKEPVKVQHEEHAAVPLPVGNYQVVIQREFVAPERATTAITGSEAAPTPMMWAGPQNWRDVAD